MSKQGATLSNFGTLSVGVASVSDGHVNIVLSLTDETGQVCWSSPITSMLVGEALKLKGVILDRSLALLFLESGLTPEERRPLVS